MGSELRCPICRSFSARFYLAKDSYKIMQCRDCRFIFVAAEQGGTTDSQEQYLKDKTSPSAYYRRTFYCDSMTFYKRLKILTRFAPGRNILDVGTNVGTFLLAAGKNGWRGWGIEPNPSAVEAGRKMGLHITKGFFDRQFVSKTLKRQMLFDAVHLGDVIEHVREPVELLASAAGLLKPGGVAMVVTPDFSSYFTRRFQVKPREHLGYFTAATIKLALKNAGLDIIYCACSSRRRNLGAMDKGTTKLGAAEKLIMFIARLPGAGRVLSWLLSVAVKDEITVIGRYNP